MHLERVARKSIIHEHQLQFIGIGWFFLAQGNSMNFHLIWHIELWHNCTKVSNIAFSHRFQVCHRESKRFSNHLFTGVHSASTVSPIVYLTAHQFNWIYLKSRPHLINVKCVLFDSISGILDFPTYFYMKRKCGFVQFRVYFWKWHKNQLVIRRIN